MESTVLSLGILILIVLLFGLTWLIIKTSRIHRRVRWLWAGGLGFAVFFSIMAFITSISPALGTTYGCPPRLVDRSEATLHLSFCDNSETRDYVSRMRWLRALVPPFIPIPDFCWQYDGVELCDSYGAYFLTWDGYLLLCGASLFFGGIVWLYIYYVTRDPRKAKEKLESAKEKKALP